MVPGLMTLTRIFRAFRFVRPSAREGANRSLAGAVDAEAWEALYAGDGAVHDDGSAVRHQL